MSEWPGWLYVASVLIPLGAFVVEALFGRWLKRFNAYLATAAIGTSCVLSLVGLVLFLPHFGTTHAGAEAASHHAAEHQAASEPYAWRGSVPWVVIGPMGVGPEMPGRADRGLPPLVIPLGIHIDGLAVIMFAMVSLVATLIHVYSMEYMRDDPRYPRFFTYLSLFCFSMLGLVASANVFMVFMFFVSVDRVLVRREEEHGCGQQGIHRESRGRCRHARGTGDPVERVWDLHDCRFESSLGRFVAP